MWLVLRDLSQRKSSQNLNDQPLHEIQKKFIELCCAVHPEALGVVMSPSQTGISTKGQVLGHQLRILGSYRLVCGSEGYQLMETKPLLHDNLSVQGFLQKVEI